MFEILKRGRTLFFAINLFFLLVVGSQAQSFFPQFATLAISIWPEYDRAEVLVIYRAQLKAETILPAQVSFRLPGYIDDLNAVAIEQEGRLIEVSSDKIELRPDGDAVWLTFPTSSRNVHFEYYDPVMLTKQAQTRQLNFAFTPPYALENVTFEFQHPVTAEDFVFTPEPVSKFTGNDALLYSTIPVANLAAEETFELSVSYRRNTDTFSQQILTNGAIINQPLTARETMTLPGNESSNLGYLLIGGGVVMLLGAGGYWWLKQAKAQSRANSGPPNNRRWSGSRSARAKKKAANPPKLIRESAAKVSSATPLAFCHQCGQAFYDEANFCHACGTKRRTTN